MNLEHVTGSGHRTCAGTWAAISQGFLRLATHITIIDARYAESLISRFKMTNACKEMEQNDMGIEP